MISNTLKLKTGNRIRSSPVLSELIRSFELQHPVQRSLTPNGIYLGSKFPYKNLYINLYIRLHVKIKMAFLLALATAKRCSKIHASAMDENHLRFTHI